MNSKIVVICLTLAFAITTSQAATIDNTILAKYICRARPDGFRAMVPGSCSQYYQCSEGKSILKSCPRFYDAIHQQCVNTNPGCVETISEPLNCEGPCCGIKDNGYAVDPQNQQIYYLCKNNCVAEKKECPNDLMFDLVQQKCSSPSNCVGCITPEPPCTKTIPTTPCTTSQPPCTKTVPTTPCITTTTCTTTTCTTTTYTTTTCTTTTYTTTTCTTTTCTTTTCTTTTCTTTTSTTTTCTTTTCTTTTSTTTTCTTTTSTTTTCTTTTSTTTTCTTTTSTTTTCTTTTSTTTTCTTTTSTTTTCTTTTCTTTTCTTTTCTTSKPPCTETVPTTPCTTKPPCKGTTSTTCSTTTTCTTTVCITTKAPCKTVNEETASGGRLIIKNPSHYVLPLKMTQEEMDDYTRYACVDKPNGFLLPSMTRCNEYYVCRNNLALSVKCGRHYFNAKKGICDLPQNTGCIQAYNI